MAFTSSQNSSWLKCKLRRVLLGLRVPERRAAALLRGAARVPARRAGGPQGPGGGRAEGRDVRRSGRGGGEGPSAQSQTPRRGGLRLPSREGREYLKHLDELSPSDVPAILAEMESAAAVGGECAESAGGSTSSSTAGAS